MTINVHGTITTIVCCVCVYGYVYGALGTVTSTTFTVSAYAEVRKGVHVRIYDQCVSIYVSL
jgi:hypothetical protein